MKEEIESTTPKISLESVDNDIKGRRSIFVFFLFFEVKDIAVRVVGQIAWVCAYLS
jgi:hypothetical protein